ncbi:MAG: hypothetical protein AAF299_08810 [Pseudomonadota bacterium]
MKKPSETGSMTSLTSILLKLEAPIIVSSMGRSGSTLCTNAIADAVAKRSFGVKGRWARKITRAEAWDLTEDRLAANKVYKTHALASELPSSFSGRVVFVFGLASDAALSVVSCKHRYGDAWIREHFRHLRAIGSFEELGERDVLRFEEQVDGWSTLTGHDILALRFDSLWDNVGTLSEFLGFDIVLPEKRARTVDKAIDQATIAEFRATYDALDRKIMAMPGCILRRKHNH